MSTNGPVIDIGFNGNIDAFIDELKKKLGNVKGVGLDKAVAGDVSKILSMLNEVQKAFNDLGHSKVNTSSFAKAQKDLLDKIKELDNRTSILETSMTSLMDAMSKTNGEKLSTELKDIITNMKTLTTETTSAVQAISQVEHVSSSVGDLKKLAKALQEVNQAFDSEKKSTNFKKTETAVKGVIKAWKEYGDIQEKIYDLQDNWSGSFEDKMNLAAFQKELVKVGDTITEMMQKSADKFGDSFYFNKDNLNISFEQISDNIDEDLEEIKKNVKKQQKEITSELEKIEKAKVSTVLDDNEKNTLKVDAKLSTTKKGLETQLRKLLEAVQPYLDDNPLKMGVSIKTEWGNKKTNQLLQDVQNAIDNVSNKKVKGEFQEKFDALKASFGNEITIKIKDDFKDEAEQTIKVYSKLKSALKKPLELNIQPKIADGARESLQEELDNISSELTISVGNVAVDEKAINGSTERLIENALDTAKRTQDSNSPAKRFEDEIGKLEVEGIAQGILNNKDLVKDAYQEVFRGISEGFSPISDKHDHQTFTTNSKNVGKSYTHQDSRGTLYKGLIDISDLFKYEGYAQYYNKLTYLGDGLTKESQDLINIFNKIVNDFRSLENVSSSVVKLEKTNGAITKFRNYSDGTSFDTRDFTSSILNKNFGLFLTDTIDEVEDNVKPFIVNLVKHLNEYQDLINKNPIDAKNNQAYGLNISTDSYGEILQKSNKYKGISFKNIYDYVDGSDTGGIIDDFLIFNKYFDDVVQTMYGIETNTKVLEEHAAQFDKIASESTSTKLGQINKSIALASKELESQYELYGNSASLDDKEKIFNSIQDNENALTNLIQQRKEIKNQIDSFEDKIKELNNLAKVNGLDGLGELFETSNLGFNKINGGYSNHGIYQNDLFTVIARDAEYEAKIDDLTPKLKEAAKVGVSVGEIIGKVLDDEKQVIYELQTTVSGTNIADNDSYIKATDEQILKLYEDIKKLNDLGLYIDINGDNILYDSNSGFSFVDLASKITENTATSPNKVFDKYFKYLNDDFYNKINSVTNIPNSTQKIEELVQKYKELNETVEKYQEFKNAGYDVGDSYSSAISELEKCKKEIEDLGFEIDNNTVKWKENVEVAKTIDDILPKHLQKLITNNIGSLSFEELNNLKDSLNQESQILDKEIYTNHDTSLIPLLDQVYGYYDIILEQISHLQDAMDDGFGDELPFDFSDDTFNDLNKIDNKFEDLKDSGKEIGKILRDDFSLENINNVYTSLNDELDKADFVGKEDFINEDKIYNQIDKIKEYAKSANYELTTSTDGTTIFASKDMDQEAQDFLNISENAEKASISKEDFVTSNREVLKSIIESLQGLNNEGKAFENLNKLLNNIGGKNGETKVEKLKNGIKEIYDLLNQNVDNDSLVIALENLANQGTNLENLATVLKASKKELLQAQQVVNSMNNDELDDLLNNHTQEIIGRARQELLNLGGENSQFVNISNLQKTKDGFIEIVGLIKNADNQMQEFTLHTKDGINMQNVGMSENTAKIAKQMKIYAQVQEYFDKKKTQGENVTGGSFFDKNANPELWEMLIDYAKEYYKELGNIVNISLKTNKNGENLFTIMGEKGSATLNPNGELVTNNQELLNVKELEKRIDSLTTKTKEYYNILKSKNINDFSQLEINNLNSIESEYNEIINLVREYSSLLGDSTNISDVFANKMSEMALSFNKVQDNYIGKVQKSLSEALDNPSHQDKTFTEEFNQQLKDTLGIVKQLKDLVDKNGSIGTLWTQEDIKLVEKYHEKIDKTVVSLKDYQNILAKSTSVDKLLTKINTDLNDNSAMPKNIKKQYLELRQQIDSIRDSVDGLNKADLTQLTNQFNSLHEAMTRSGKTGRSVLDQIGKAIESQSVQFIARYLSLQDLVRYGRQAFTTIYDLDTALVDLKKTTTMDTKELNEFYLSANNVAKSMGVTTKEIIEQASSWSRLGYSSKEAASTMAELSSQFASISPGMTTEEAQIGLVSIMKAWDVDVSDVEREIMDNINVLGNKFAETNNDIVEGMKRAGATLSAIGMDVTDSFALFTGAQEVIQNAETVGTALKTLSLRIRGKSLPPYTVMYMLCI